MQAEAEAGWSRRTVRERSRLESCSRLGPGHMLLQYRTLAWAPAIFYCAGAQQADAEAG